MQQQQCNNNDGVHQTTSKSRSFLAHKPRTPAPIAKCQQHRAKPLPPNPPCHPITVHATPRQAARADQVAASPSAPPRLPRPRPREHATACSTGHLRAQHCRKPPATSRHPLSPGAAPTRSPVHRCPSGLVQQRRRRVTSSPHRESRRPSCLNRH
jgi:hypothetical protein